MQPVEVSVPDIEVLQAKTMAAEVLLVGADDWAISDAASQFQAAGRVVHRCCETTEAPFPCNALVPERGCPLDRHEVDVVVLIRSRPAMEPSLVEMGAICGLRDGLPLVIAGMTDGAGLSAWATRVPPSGEIVATCDEVVARQD